MPRDKHVNAYLDPDSINYYETLFNRAGVQVLEINTCLGAISIGVSQNYSAFLDEKYDSTLAIDESTHSALVFSVEQGVQWIAVH